MKQLQIIDSKSLSEKALRNIVLIDNAIPTEFDPNWNPTESDHDERLKHYRELSESGFFKAAFLNEQLVGFHLIGRGRGVMKNIGFISTLWTHPEHRGKGVATYLKNLGLEWARNEKLDYLQTMSHSTNTKMIEMNLKAGFKPHAVSLRLKL